jgi:hypothetical protein
MLLKGPEYAKDLMFDRRQAKGNGFIKSIIQR